MSLLREHMAPLADLSLFAVGPAGRRERRFRALARRLGAPLAFTAALRAGRPNVVHCNSSVDAKAMSRDLAFVALCRLLRVPVLLQFHGGDVEAVLAGGSLGRWLLGALVRLAARTIFLTRQQLAPAARAFPTRRHTLRRIANMAPLAAAPAAPANPATRPTLLFLGRIVAAKGVFELVEAMRLLAECGVAATLVIAGQGPDEAALRQRVAALGLADRVTFAGYLRGDAKEAALGQASAVVLPTYHTEGLPYTLLEAMARGVPVVACPSGGVAELVDGDIGLLVPPRDPRALAAALAAVLSDAALRARLGAAARRRVQEAFSPEVITGAFLAEYQALTCASPSAQGPEEAWATSSPARERRSA